MLLLRTVVVEHAAVRVLLRKVRVLHEAVARRVVHDQREGKFGTRGQRVQTLTEGFDLLVHIGTRLLAVRLLLAQLIGHTADHALHRVEVSALRGGGDVQLDLGNADRAVVALDHLTIQVLFINLLWKSDCLVRNGQLVAHAALLNRRSTLDFVVLKSAMRACVSAEKHSYTQTRR